MNQKEQLHEKLKNILEKNYQVQPPKHILLVYDTQCKLSSLLAAAYQEAIKPYPHQSIDFDNVPERYILDAFAQLPANSLVILVQSGSFRMTKYRLRADLFRQGHQVIEHARLSFNAEDQIGNYIDSLNYDTPYYVQACNSIEELLIHNNTLTIESGENLRLTVTSEFEKPIKNTADFSGNPTASTGFPIGEIFTEAKELDKINGSVVVFGFPTLEHKTHFCEPFTVTIQDGCLISHTGPDEFEKILHLIKKEEEGNKVQIREIGFGLNRGIGFEKRINEPTAFERFAGMHFSLGLKHAMYRKKFKKQVHQKYHVDIFCKVERVFIGETKVMENGKYVVGT